MDSTVSSPENVFRLVYRSTSTFPTDDTERLGDIFNAARTNNKSRGITGALMVCNGNFVQTLEGEEAAVRSLFDIIRQDPRHSDIEELSADAGRPRLFGRWAMARVTPDGGPDIRLLSNRNHGKIVEAGPGVHTTEAQEEHLESMRSAVA